MPAKINLLFFVSVIFLFIFSQSIKSTNAAAPTDPPTIKFGTFPVTLAPRPTITPLPTDPFAPPPTLPPYPTFTPTPTPNFLIMSLVAQIQANCAYGVVHLSNLNCIYGVNIPNPNLPATLYELEKSVKYATLEHYLQCVGFVHGSVMLNDGFLLPSPCGNAINHPTCPDLLVIYRFIPKNEPLKVNDLPVWNYAPYGHIAYVVNVFDANNFQVAEANLSINGQARLYNKTVDDPDLMGWLTKR